MIKRIFVVFSILAFFALIWTTNSSFAGGGGGCEDTGCNNVMIGIAVGTVVLVGIAILYSYYSNPKAKDQSFFHDNSLPALNFVDGNKTLKTENQLSPNESEQGVMKGGKFVVFRW